MESGEYAGSQTRRAFIGAGVAGFTLLGAKPALAQQVRLPELGETLALLESTGGISLIYSRFSLAFSLTLDLAVRNSGADTRNPAPAAKLPVLPNGRRGTAELFGIISQLSNAERRNAALSALRKRGEDPLGDGRGEALSGLLDTVAASLAKNGWPIEKGPVADALGACGHVERIAVVTRDTSSDSSVICGYFPFSFFC